MSWAGPAVGAPASVGYWAQPAHQAQPLKQHSYPTNAPPNNAPRTKKGGSKPIITRYAPPPGYRGPAQPQAPYGQYPYQQPQQPYGPQPPYQQGQQPYTQGQPPSSYPAPAYGAAPAGYPPQQGYTPSGYAPPQGYTPHTGYLQQPNVPAPNYKYQQPPNPGSQGYAQPVGQPTVPQATYPQPHAPYSQLQGWQAPNAQSSYPSNPPYQALPTAPQLPQANVPQGIAQLLPTTQTSNNEPLPVGLGKTHPFFTVGDEWNYWDFESEGPIWPKANEPVDPHFSLGVSIWKPPKQSTRCLPNTFAEAEAQSLKPPGKKIAFGESVSEYFTPENHYDAFVDIRQTAVWDVIKDDPVFVKLPKIEDMDLMPPEECIQMRDRPDLPVEEEGGERQQSSQDNDTQASGWSIMDNLEQALSGQAAHSNHSDSHKNKTQEDILAKLGVTGSPKPPSDDPMDMPPDVRVRLAKANEKPPPSLPPKPSVLPPDPSQPIYHPATGQRAQSYGGSHSGPAGTSLQRPYASFSGLGSERQQQHHPRNNSTSTQHPNHHTSNGTHNGHGPYDSNGHSGNSQASPTSANTVTSSNGWSRKRSRHDVDGSEHGDQQRNESKRKRSSLVSDPYGRR